MDLSRDQPNPTDAGILWRRVIETDTQRVMAVADLENSNVYVVAVIRSALRHPSERRTALRILSELGEETSLAVLDAIVDFGVLSNRDSLLARRIIGQIRRADLLIRLPAIVRNRILTADDDDYRRLAELLDHLGMDELLGEIAGAAPQSSDPHVREVGLDYSR